MISILHYHKNKNSYPLTDGNVYCPTIEDLVNKGYVISDLETGNGNKVDTKQYVKINVQNSKYQYEITKTCIEKK